MIIIILICFSFFFNSRLPQAEIVLTSMLNNKTKGVNCLIDRILHYLPKGPKYFPDDEVSLHDTKNTIFYV